MTNKAIFAAVAVRGESANFLHFGEPKRDGAVGLRITADLMALIPNLRAFAISLCGDVDHADDLVQDTLVRAWSNIGSFSEGTNLRAWLFRISRNIYYSEYRKKRREVADPDGALAASLSAAPAQGCHMDLLDLCAALQKLPSDLREALILIGASGLSYHEVASICGCAIGTIKSRVNRARNRLAKLLSVRPGEEFWQDSACQIIQLHVAAQRPGHDGSDDPA
ncbi:MAG: sigma-70 family RNA polymerase sigma factor [Methylocapsa sp.]|nr:sigma-70 family RNA polymerase sigma factor [Methylocapsa sp.]